jgi:ATP-dependent Lon protease
MTSPEANLTDFSGIARLFPLPSVALFPRAVAPLHIFEPRYRAMMEDALAGDRLIAMALLNPGWEKDYEGRPPVAAVVCVGRILTHARLDDGRFNLLLAGAQRAVIRRELPPEQPFRLAEVELLEDLYSPEGAASRETLREELKTVLSRSLPESPAAREQLEQMLTARLPLGELVDVIAHSAPWPAEFKQQLLEEMNVDRRAALVLERLRRATDESSPADAPSTVWPPRFSDN